ncbi:MAG: acyl-CoA reductase [Lachnospiraceae bacterium]|jgi:hypothetical protein|nr:acyl-CoA reductase [Lachnospiraceae bacterium]MEE3461123.1 acyl-CoA reductase [Lachnospiraceae bacterium]
MLIRSVENNAPDFRAVKVLSGHIENIDFKPLRPFDEKVIEFLNAVSRDLMRSSEARLYPEVITFAFFCRKGNLLKIREGYEDRIGNRVGRGLIFHVAPSNVPVNFAYTLISGLLSGNANIVKASSKDFPQVRIIADAINRTVEQYPDMKPYANVIIYDRDRQDLTEYFSGMANVRVIWGGDRTIESVRKAPVPPRAVELTFADRYSLAVIKSEAILSAGTDEIAGLAQDFYNDTYLFDQNACTSPRLIYWLGDAEKTEAAKQIFWEAIYGNIKDRYIVEAETAVNKLLAVDRTAITIAGSRLEKDKDNRIVRVNIPELPFNIPDLREAGGFFHEFTCETLEMLEKIVNEKYQTISYFGIDPDDIREFVISHGLRGIDRITPIGHTSDWGMTWDGYDLIETMSRAIVAF